MARLCAGSTARRLVAGGGFGLLLLLAGCQAPLAAAPATATAVPDAPAVSATPVATTKVTIESFAFAPAAIVVPVGATVTWTNRDVEQHTVTALDRGFNSDALNQDQPFSATLAKPGTYPYQCLIHPQMRGTVVVR